MTWPILVRATGVGLPLALAMALCTLLAVGARTRYLHVELRISMLLKVCYPPRS